VKGRAGVRPLVGWAPRSVSCGDKRKKAGPWWRGASRIGLVWAAHMGYAGPCSREKGGSGAV
jgi:hypothetical protein